jgi:hypothetical protein
MVDNSFLDHLPDRKGFASVALAVRGQKPIEATIWIVGSLLLGKKQNETVTVRKRRPSGAKIVPRCGLGASVQHDNERGIVREIRRPMHEHPQIAWVGSEPEVFPQAAVDRSSGTMTLQRFNEFPPSSPAAAEAECPSQIYHYCPFPIAGVT